MSESDTPAPTVEQRLDKMGNDLHALRVLYEHHDTQIKRVAEVQVAHGEILEQHSKVLDEINGKLAPLASLNDFVHRVADEHEGRIKAVEERISAE